MKWCGGQDAKLGTTASTAKPASAASTAGSTSMPLAAGPSASGAEKAKDPEHRQVKWHEVAQWMDQDPRTKPAGPLSPKCDPFQTGEGWCQWPRSSASRPRWSVARLRPRVWAWCFRARSWGGSRSVARISGRTYEKGKPIEVATKDGKSFTFVLTQIEAKRVVLDREGAQYELRIQPSKRSGQIELLGSLP